MASFQLTSGSSTFDFDTAGGVSCNAIAVGSWITGASNQIVVTQTGGSTVTFPVDWLFNGRNQLTIRSAGAEIFNFATAGLRNSFETRNAVLRVKPDRANSFVFELRGDWAMDLDHNLTFTAGGLASTLDGFVSDPLGRFIYHFADKDNPLYTSVLGFVGSWQSSTGGDGTPLLEFHYQNETGGQGVFQLPKAATINRGSNQLTYTYQKGNKTLSIDFQGTLMLGPDLEITYVVDRQVSSSGDEMVSATTLGFDTVIAAPNLHGDLQLTVKKPDGSPGACTLTIGGQCQGVLGKTNLQVGFTFTQTFGGANNQITRTAAFNGSLAFTNGQIQWTFSATGTTIDLAVGADIKFGPIQADVRLNIPLDNGQVGGVTCLLGISF